MARIGTCTWPATLTRCKPVGSKEVLLGDSRYRYDSAHYLLATVELPVVGQVLEASA